VTRNALGDIDRSSTLGGGRIDDVLVVRPGASPASPPDPARRQVRGKIFHHGSELGVGDFRTFGNHIGHLGAPLVSGHSSSQDHLGRVTSAAHLLENLFAGRVW
jgi:hypothetical protein